ncbi:MAG TPA: hypothetical protein VK880_11885, partial [Anaerolineales bacterium]|nr:hypothetical protein [Anaerolineales bacterium]
MSPEKTSKRQERRAQLQRQQRQQQLQRLITIGLIVIGAGLLVFAVVWPQIQSANEPTAAPVAVSEIVTVAPEALPNANGLSLGDPNATVTIDVF